MVMTSKSTINTFSLCNRVCRFRFPRSVTFLSFVSDKPYRHTMSDNPLLLLLLLIDACTCITVDPSLQLRLCFAIYNVYRVGFLLRLLLPFGVSKRSASRPRHGLLQKVGIIKEGNERLTRTHTLIRFCQCIDVLLSKLPLRLDFQNSVPMDTAHGFLSPIYIVVCSLSMYLWCSSLSLSLCVVICHIVCT